MKLIISLVLIAVSSVASAQNTTTQVDPAQDPILNYVSTVCVSKAQLESVLAGKPDQIQQILGIKDLEVNFWKNQAVNVINTSMAIVEKGAEEAKKEENVQTVAAGIQTCQDYFTIQPYLAAAASQGIACVDSQDQTIDFAPVEAACTKFVDVFNKTFTP